MPDSQQYPKPVCADVDFSPINPIQELPFRQLCGPLPPIFNPKNPETYFGFSTSCVDIYNPGYFIINGMDSGRVLAGGFDGTQKLAPVGINKTGTQSINGYLVRVEQAVALPSWYETGTHTQSSGFCGYGQPAIIQKVYLNSVDPESEINQFPPEYRDQVLDLMRSSKEPDCLWIAMPIQMSLLKPAKVVNNSLAGDPTVTIDLQLDYNGGHTVQIVARKQSPEDCLPAGTRGLASYQTDVENCCVEANLPVWTFISLEINKAILVRSQGPVAEGETAEFNVVSSDESNAGTQTATAIARFACPNQLGIAVLQNCAWTVAPYSTGSIAVSTRAVVTECSNTALARVKYSFGEIEQEQYVLRADVVMDTPCVVAGLPVGTPGIIIETQGGESCEGDTGTSLKFTPFNTLGSVIVEAEHDIHGASVGQFKFHSATGIPDCPDGSDGFPFAHVTAELPPDTIMCAGDLGLLQVGPDCRLIVTPLPSLTSPDTL